MKPRAVLPEGFMGRARPESLDTEKQRAVSDKIRTEHGPPRGLAVENTVLTLLRALRHKITSD